MSIRFHLTCRVAVAVAIAIAIACGVVLRSPPARAQDPSRKELSAMSRDERVGYLQSLTWEMRATRVRGTLAVDGRLDDDAWATASWITDFYQTETHEGLPSTERSEAAVLYDDNNLYIAFNAYDSDPERAQAWAMFRDEAPSADDAVAIMIDPFNDRRSAIFLGTNANGLVFDMLQTGERSDTRNRDWDAVWTARGSRSELGWQVEIAVPFKSLRFEPRSPGEEVVFGIGFKRNIPRRNEEATWPFVSNDSTWYRPAELGHLRGMTDVRPGRAIEIRPYVLAGGTIDYDEDARDRRTEAGGDIKWGVTSGLTADFTINTDFAQEEADVQQINFSRFSLFFPEKRQIFLEGQRTFQFGVPREADLIFTRRIGLSPRGQIIPLLAGARLSGRHGAYSIGATNVQTDDAFGFPAENFTVLRVRRDVFTRSSIGALFTNREGGGRYNRVYGADVNFFFNRVWFVEGFVAAQSEPDSLEGTSSLYGRIAYDADRFGAVYRYLDLGENFRPGIGFVRRPDSRESFGEVRFSPRPKWSWVRQFDVKASTSYVTNHASVLETRSQTAEFAMTLETGDVVSAIYDNRHEFLIDPFTLRPGVDVTSGSYDFDTLELRLQSFRRRQLVWNASYTTGGFWDGERETISLRNNYRVNRNVSLDVRYDFNRVDLPDARFTTHLASSRFQVAFRVDLVLLALVQYNSNTEGLSSNIRFNWIPKPGTDFFIVYNELDDAAAPFRVRNRSLSVKFNYLFAL